MIVDIISKNLPSICPPKVFILEIGCCFDSCLAEASGTSVSGSGYKCTFLVFISGSFGHVHKLVTRGLKEMPTFGGAGFTPRLEVKALGLPVGFVVLLLLLTAN